MTDFCVVAGGWSASQVALDRLPGTIIGVNDAALHLPRCDIVVSMDRLWTEHRWPDLCRRAMPAWLRRSATKNVPALAQAWCHLFDCDHTGTRFSQNTSVLNGTHSGYCALNLAFALRARRLFLIGFDMMRGPQMQAHWFPPYPWAAPGGATKDGKFREWAAQFGVAAKQFRAAGVKVFNVSPRTAIEAFPVVSPREFEALAA